ncbi:alpha/beta-hydrolase [Dichomitus squalens LYAD-421 SS1]|uniref:Alpha/beta-hydrolase n=1 Tax=Dichomitus squalens (strain LYAD-421) TaxID=732165 RepID=R7SN76_DICSQ|nr:alpha/beta-hydrolase [Dichomitus squalens LYAD-421 SS1]EJF57363.1 alpha/beta-hydrolase [Dichomitus squalens LYAD-421 SS1]
MPPKKRYTYQADMPYARQPLKAFYVFQRLFTSIVMCAWWAVYYSIMPRSRRPRPSWTLKCVLSVNFTRRIYKVTELAGVTWGTRDPDKECSGKSLKYTRFEWVPPLPEDLRTGVIADPQVPFRRVGCFVWPKERPKIIPACVDDKSSPAPSQNPLMDLEESVGDVPLIGIFLHGGGYCHMSAHENAPTSQIPARLIKDKAFTEIHSVEYRLLQHAPFPAAVQDAAAVYAHIVRRHQRLSVVGSGKSSSQSSGGTSQNGHVEYLTVDGNYGQRVKDKRENAEIHARLSEVIANTHCKIVLIGDSAGGNLVLALARWIRDEGVLPPPDGLLLLSPSCDPSHAFPESPSSYVPRPHAETDYLVDTPEPRALLQRTFLGHNPLETMHSPYVSPASQRVLTAFYGDAFAASVADLTIAQLNDDHRQFLRTMASAPATPLPMMSRDNSTAYGFGDTTAPLVVGPPEITPTNTIGTVSSGRGRVNGKSSVNGSGNDTGNDSDTGNSSGDEDGPPHGHRRSPTSLAHPMIGSPRGLSLFTEFPRTCVVLGDAERLEREVTKLVGAMERDGTEVHTIWVKDAPHDVLQMKWWDERVRDTVWKQVEEWVATV